MLQDPWMPLGAKSFFSAFVPFPRSTWIHPNVPRDALDHVCKIIWSRAVAQHGRGESSPQGPPDEIYNLSDNQQRGR